MELTLVAVIVVALFFDFTNGFHDTANAIATIVYTKTLTPKQAVIGAAILNFAGAFVSLHVATTIATGIVDANILTLNTVLAGLIGAIIWNLITWRIGLPSSSSHALIGGLVGASVVTAGALDVVKWSGLLDKVLLPSLLSPFAGLLGAFLLMWLVLRYMSRRHVQSSGHVFKTLQLVSGGFVALMHGTNDAQKTMGIITIALVTAGVQETFHVETWVIFSSALVMAAGTYLGGWRIIQTVGSGITQLDMPQGFAAQTSTAVTLGMASEVGFPVSTTQTISGAIAGAGLAKKGSFVNWRVIKNIVTAWVITMPLAALMGMAAETATRLPYGVGFLLLIFILLAATIYFTRNWTGNVRDQAKVLLSMITRRRRTPH